MHLLLPQLPHRLGPGNAIGWPVARGRLKRVSLGLAEPEPKALYNVGAMALELRREDD